MSITINLKDYSALKPASGTVWITGWINGGDSAQFKVLQSNGTFEAPPAGGGVPFLKVDSLSSITLDEATNGANRLMFVVSQDKPAPLSITNFSPKPYTQYPYMAAPGVAPAGPYDIFEFGMNAAFDLSAVNGFGLNLGFSATGPDGAMYRYGVRETVTRKQVQSAYSAFIENEKKHFEGAEYFKELLYTGALPGSGYTPPMIGDEFFAICDPNDMLAAKTANYGGTTTDPLSTYWDDTVTALFKHGNMVSIALGAANYLGIALDTSRLSAPPAVPANCTSTAFQFDIKGEHKYIFQPESGLRTAEFVFRQSGFTTPGYGSDPIISQLQNNLIEAICRGVVLDGVKDPNGASTNNGFSTTAWNNDANWYKAGSTCHYYAKFLHCSDTDGKDYRTSNTQPIFYGGSAYGFSMDENPANWPASAAQVPSKTPFNISSGTVDLWVGPYENQTHKRPNTGQYAFGFGTGCEALAPVVIDGQTYKASGEGAIGGVLPDLPHWTKMEFHGPGSGHYIWIKNGQVATGDCLSKPVEQPQKTPHVFAWPAGTDWKPGATPPQKPSA
ncbi:hypothetical protein JM93_01111 [Roseibium hamelinense]|uniref:Beta-1,3-glucanase n=1 Tax=Roseibium hamelinense TaxID=150831 RepID=A0A562TAH4_9HYPH|nr:hypothetical protein [Roseibium hamelinense]MTI45492.1 hypothetical protein [Roseibium hamelinense]TWI90134.1 hypothetical protein JM93_01111 [Roseibium hamelinense]